MRAVDTPHQPQGTQLTLEGKPTPAEQARVTKQPIGTLRLVPRDLQVLTAIHEYGGCLTTVQIAMLFWPPDLRRRLAMWGSPQPHIEAWLATYPPAFLLTIVDALIWGQKINRLRQSQQVCKAEAKLVAWLHSLDPRLAEDLVPWLDSLAAVAQEVWLAQAIEQQRQPPQAFFRRPRFPSDSVSSACKSRLQALVAKGLLEPQEQPVKLSEGRAQTVYFLTRKGFTLVAEAKGMNPKALDYKAAGAYGPLHLAHRLLINHFRIALTSQCALKQYRIVDWVDDNQLRRLLAKEKVTLTRLVRDPQTGEQQENKEHHVLKVPDGFFIVEMGTGVRRHCFLEIDNQSLTLESSTNTKDYASKIRVLSAFYKGRYKELFPSAGDSMWLLTVTTGSEERLKHLKATAEGVIGQQNKAVDRYWFTTTDRIPTWEDYFNTAIFRPIWLRGGSDRLWSLDETL